MNAKVFYASMTGNTKKVADAIAAALGCAAVNAADAPVAGGEKIDVAFVGGAVYATYDHDFRPELRDLIGALAKADVRLVVPFGTYAFENFVGRLRAKIAAAGLTVSDDAFACRGKFLFFNRKSPSGAELAAAADFAKRIADSLRS